MKYFQYFTLALSTCSAVEILAITHSLHSHYAKSMQKLREDYAEIPQRLRKDYAALRNSITRHYALHYAIHYVIKLRN